MATVSTTSTLQTLIINKVPNQATYDNMVANNQINSNQLYFVVGAKDVVVDNATEGTTNGTIIIHKTNGTTASVPVHGLGSNAYSSVTFAPLNSPNLTGSPTAPTPGSTSGNTAIATKEYVDSAFAVNDAMIFKGTLSGGTSSPGSYTPAANRGHTYKVSTAGYINGVKVEVGDTFICTTDNTAAAASGTYSTVQANWVVVQTNIDGYVIGPASAVGNNIALFDGNTGKLIKDSGLTIATSVPSGALFTDQKVAQGTTTTSSWRKVLLNGGSGTVYSAWNTAVGNDVTDNTYRTVGVAVQPSTNTLKANNLEAATSIKVGTLTLGGSADPATKTIGSSSTLYLSRGDSASIIFQRNTVSKARFDTSDNFRPETNNTLSIGTSDYKWASMYATTFNGALNGTAKMATTAGGATTAAYSKTANFATTAAYSVTGAYAASAGTAGIAGTATFAVSAGHSNTAGTATFANSSLYAGTANYAVTAGNATVAGKLGTATVGASTKPIYLNNGSATACEYMLPEYNSNIDFTTLTQNASIRPMNAQTNPVTNATEYGGVLTFPAQSHGGNGYNAQLIVSAPSGQASPVHAYIRRMTNSPSWSNWSTLIDNNNYTTYTVKKDGTGANGTWGISVTGNANTSTTSGFATTAAYSTTAAFAATANYSGTAGYATTAGYSTNNGVEYIVGTQTAATGTWTGITTSSNIYTGKTIAYKLPYAGSGSASLALTLPDGTTSTAAIYLNTTRVTTHYGAGSVVLMTFDGTYWRCTDYWNSNSRDAGYGSIALSQSTAETAITTNTTTPAAKTYNEKITLAAGNKWVQFAGTNSGTAGSDVLTVGHSLSGVTSGNYGDSSAQTPAYGGTFNVPYISVDAAGHITEISSHTVKIPASDNSNTTYTFANGTNGFTVTPSGGTAQTVTVTPSITNNVTGSGTSGYLAKFTGANTIGNGPQIGSGTTTFLRNDGSWATPSYATTAAFATTATRASGANITTTSGGVAYYSNTTGTFANDADLTWDATNNSLHVIHAKNAAGEFRTTYSTTVDMWLGVGSGNTNHGIYDAKAGKWMIVADTSGNVTVNGNANTATTAGFATTASRATTAGFATTASRATTAGNATDATKLPLAGGTMTGTVTIKGIKGTSGTDYGATLPASGSEGQLFFQTGAEFYELPTGGAAGQALIKNSASDRDVTWGSVGGTMKPTTTTKYYVSGSSATTENSNPALFNTAIYVENNVLFGAAWNDYAEYRTMRENIIIPYGYCVCENGDDTVSISTERMQPGPAIISDTFGYAIGKTEKANVPVAIAGRVLAYPYEDRNEYQAGDCVCAAPGGTISKMTRDEIRDYPDRIVGIVSAIPEYEEWGTGKVKVNGRIWIKVR